MVAESLGKDVTTAGVALVVAGVVDDDAVEEDEAKDGRVVVTGSAPLVLELDTGAVLSTASFTDSDSIVIIFGGASDLCVTSAMVKK